MYRLRQYVVMVRRWLRRTFSVPQLRYSDIELLVGGSLPHRGHLRLWIRDLARLTVPRLFALNLVRQIRLDASYAALYREFLERLGEVLHQTKSGALTPASPLVSFQEQIVYASDLHGPELCCRGRAASDRGQVATIIDALALMHFNPPRRPTYIRNEAHFLELIRNGSVRGDDLTGVLRTARPLRWVTTAAAIDECVSQAPSGARTATLRNSLGLIHFDKDACLIEVRYPLGLVPPGLSAPTAIDAGIERVFRAAHRDDGWGCAVNLAPPHGDGLPEAVHRPVSLRPGFELRCHGEPEVQLPAMRWRAIERRVRRI